MSPDKIRIAVAECLGLSIPCQGEHEPYEVFHKYSGAQGCRLYRCRNCVMHKWEEYSQWETDDERSIPNYPLPASLDACAEFERTLQGEVFEQYYAALFNVLNWDNKFWGKQRDLEMIRATALQRCEAYLRVKGKWLS